MYWADKIKAIKLLGAYQANNVFVRKDTALFHHLISLNKHYVRISLLVRQKSVIEQ